MGSVSRTGISILGFSFASKLVTGISPKGPYPTYPPCMCHAFTTLATLSSRVDAPPRDLIFTVLVSTICSISRVFLAPVSLRLAAGCQGYRLLLLVMRLVQEMGVCPDCLLIYQLRKHHVKRLLETDRVCEAGTIMRRSKQIAIRDS